MRRSEAPEVALAAEAGPLREDGQGNDLGVGEQGRTAGLAGRGGMALLPPVVHEYVQCDQEGVEVHDATPPLGEGLVPA